MTVHGYASFAPTVTASDGSAGPVSHNSTTHSFSVPVNAGSDHNAVIALKQPKRPAPRYGQPGPAGAMCGPIALPVNSTWL